MKLKDNMHVVWIVFAVFAVTIFFSMLDRYWTAQVEFSAEECNHRAYMIYKAYDDQADDVRFEDWLTRVEECATISADYFKGQWY